MSQVTKRLSLTDRFPLLLSMIRNRWILFTIRAVFLSGFLFSILVGLFGSPVGSHNFLIMFVWIVWWTILKVFLIPFGGRSWCTVCPIPMPGDWIQQQGLITNIIPQKNRKKFPKIFRNTWLQAAGFLMIGLFGAQTLTMPNISAWVFVGLFSAATGMAIVFEKRSFCRYVCPMGGYIGWYALLAPLEIRVKNRSICSAHTSKDCIHGNQSGAGCPWMVSPINLKDNSRCGACTECFRTCTQENVTLNIRPFGSDLNQIPNRLDDAYLGSVLMASVLAFSAIYLGHWAPLKSAAFHIGSPEWWLFSAVFLIFAAVLIPASLWLCAVLIAKTKNQSTGIKRQFIQMNYTMIPVSFFAWLAFTVSFALPKMAYVFPVLSDPFGFGWNLFGTAQMTWFPIIPNLVDPLVVILIMTGFVWTVYNAKKNQFRLKQNNWFVSATAVFSGLFSGTLLWLLVG